ncbi:MAG: Fic family protein [Cellvibrionaceae bacterium]
MKAIKTPPEWEHGDPLEYLMQNHSQDFPRYMEWYSPVDAKGRYLPFDELRHRVDKDLSIELSWGLTKASRLRQYQGYLPAGSSACPYYLTPLMQKTISVTDRHTTTAALEWMTANIGEAKHFQYLLNDLIEDEAISSSQLEGAATTTLVAKDMLKRQRQPRTLDEKMILGNYQMMRFAWEHRNAELSPELIAQMHEEGVSGVDDDAYTPGVFRQTDDVVVEGVEGEVVHQPPAAKGIHKRLNRLCTWINTCHDDAQSRNYLHPLIKAIAIHFAIGYEHPFRDGNGRVARALFYWFMFKSGFGAFRYIAISTLLKKAATKYGKSYLYTETDDMDLTYFIDYQCSIIIKAIDDFVNGYRKAHEDQKAFNAFLWESGLFKKMNDKQTAIVHVAQNRLHKDFTAANVKENLDCAYNTANAALKGLVDLGIFEREKQGKEWIYNLKDQDKIKKDWRGKKG